MGHDKLFQKRKALTRPEKTRRLRRILIVCEGTKTEPNYFKAFKADQEVFDAIDVQGTGYNTISLITEAIRLKNEAVQKNEPYIETWCVFDKDDFTIDAFDKAIKMAEQNKIKCAYSIEAFEVWYLLHFSFFDSALLRSHYNDKLSKLLNKAYKKNDPGMYALLSTKQSRAIQNARKLYNKQYLLPLKDRNPITTVFQLVERLIG